MKPFSIATIFCLAFAAVVAEVSQQQHFYRREENERSDEYLRLETPLRSWKATSRLDCVKRCSLMQPPNYCFALQFDEISGNCAAGHRIVAVNGIPPYPHPQTVFFTAHESNASRCVVEHPGFSYFVEGDDRVCLFVSEPEDIVTQTAAEIRCSALGARMYVMDTINKFNILNNNRKGDSDNVWVGLTKQMGLDEFYWADGTRFLPGKLWDRMWHTAHNQPEMLDSEPCVVSRRMWLKLSDMVCWLSLRYACEIVMN